MRTRTNCNPHNEAHGKTMCAYDWIAPPGTDPLTVPDLIETAVPGLRVRARKGDDEVHGYVNTGRLLDGSLHVCLCLYEFECLDADCGCGEGAIKFRKAPALTAAQVTAMVLTCGGEHSEITDENADRVLELLRK